MKKIFLTFFILLSFFYLTNWHLVYAQVPQVPIPGVDCGNAQAQGVAKNCCKKVFLNPPALPGVIRDIPQVGSWLENFTQDILKLQRATNTVACVIGSPSPAADDPNCICLKETEITPSPIAAAKQLCADYVTNSSEKSSCEDCANAGGVWTAIGCVYGDLPRFLREKVLGWGLGIAGGVALLCILYAAFMLQTSGGNPEKIKKAQELLTSCIMGLMLIIFSIFILKLIGVDILRIPGFGK